ncbi:MAG TPA: GNAT family N-acetyltransferase [Prolixibacteraceae bacterium]|jgi:putative acetyltransferase
MGESDNLVIFKAEQFHALAIHRLIEEVLGSYDLYNRRPTYVDNDIDDLFTHYFNNKGYFWVAKIGNQNILATVAIYKIDDNTCELRKMYLRTQEHGKGIGKLLLNKAIAKAKEIGYTKMVLKTNSKLNTAIGMYQKYGFSYCVISDEDKLTDCDVAMELDL